MLRQKEARMLGPWMTLALVIGGVVGSGIFYLPIALAPLGGSVPIGRPPPSGLTIRDAQ